MTQALGVLAASALACTRAPTQVYYPARHAYASSPHELTCLQGAENPAKTAARLELVVAANAIRPVFTKCYQQYLGISALGSGEVCLLIATRESGAVHMVAASNTAPRALLHCIMEVAAEAHFPASKRGGERISLPLRFEVW